MQQQSQGACSMNENEGVPPAPDKPGAGLAFGDRTAPPTTAPAKFAELVFVQIPYVVTGSLLFIAIAINFANVIARYFFHEAIYWAEEVLIFITMWGVMLAGATITYRGLHIRMDLFTATLRSPFKEMIGALTALLMVFGTLYVVVQSWTVVGLYIRNGEASITAGIPLTIPHLAVPVGFSLMALAVLVRARNYITGRFE